MYTFIQLILKDLISFKCTGHHYKSQRVDLAVPYCQLCNYVYGIVYEMLKCFIPHMFFDSSASINHVAFR